MFSLVHFGSIETDEEKEQQEFTTEFKKLLTWTKNGPSNNFIDTDFGNGTITINRKGTYVINYSIAFEGTNEKLYVFSLFNNNSQVKAVRTGKYFAQNLKVGVVTALGMIEIDTVPAVLDVRGRCTEGIANVVNTLDAGFNVFQIVPTA